MERITVGGQAIIEGVMMRSESVTATAVRSPSGEIILSKKMNTPYATSSWRKKPFIRGVVVLLDSLSAGVNALAYSSYIAEEKEEKTDKWELLGAGLLAMLFVMGVFFILPTVIVVLCGVQAVWLKNVLEGSIRLAIFLCYVYGISRCHEIRRVFQYHGAEHKTIFAYEAGVELLPENVRPFSRFHPRCGTSFLLVVMLVSIVVFAFLGWSNLLYRFFSWILLFPIVAGISYELIQISIHSQHSFWRVVIGPGLWLQRLTTQEPDDEMLEVAIAALQAVIEDKKIIEV